MTIMGRKDDGTDVRGKPSFPLFTTSQSKQPDIFKERCQLDDANVARIQKLEEERFLGVKTQVEELSTDLKVLSKDVDGLRGEVAAVQGTSKLTLDAVESLRKQHTETSLRQDQERQKRERRELEAAIAKEKVEAEIKLAAEKRKELEADAAVQAASAASKNADSNNRLIAMASSLVDGKTLVLVVVILLTSFGIRVPSFVMSLLTGSQDQPAISAPPNP